MVPLTNLSPGLISIQWGLSRTVVLTATIAAAAWLSVDSILKPRRMKKDLIAPSPLTTVLPALQEQEAADLPYPPDALPGGRDVLTPYGSIRVYEWGPEQGERVLFVHGISTPAVSLGNLGHELAGRGCRVMLFDLFGRGYSDAPKDLDYDARLYVTQMLLVLSSSKVPWTLFHLVGYSLGGGLCVSFTRYFPHLVSSLTLVASGGLIRPYHVGWQSWLLYSSGLLPEFIVRILVRRRIRPKSKPQSLTTGGIDIMVAETKKNLPNGDGDSNGGDGFDTIVISKSRPNVTVSSVVRWQVDYHEGFITAFLSSIRNAPIYAPQHDWKGLAMLLETGRRLEHGNKTGSHSGMHAGKVHMILGEDDAVVVKEETMEDADRILGSDGVEFTVLPGGHGLPTTTSSGVADAIEGFWHKY
ncbi:alpha/beta-hydrolase [Jackrogersella minutella]|nr:alpha/beta-hydrolase [Jackrogersella minutella]